MREPLVLLHGGTGVPTVWRHVVPLLSGEFDVHTPAALGHLGGNRPATRPITLAMLADDAEAFLDAHGLDRPHLAGNSMGGATAIELARRGRAKTVAALSPAYTWEPNSADHRFVTSFSASATRQARAGRRVARLALRSRAVRRYSLRTMAEHGDRVTPRELLETLDGLLAADLHDEIRSHYEPIAALDPPPCPMTVAWAEHDRFLRIDTCGATARRLFPGAVFEVMPGVGHVPMFDDPALVADVIRRSAHQADDPVHEPAGAED